MTFSATTRPGAILFDSWEPQTDGQYVGALVGVAMLGMLHQLLVLVRAEHFRWALRAQRAAPHDFSLLLHRLINGTLFAIVVAGSYLAMLVAMSECLRSSAAPQHLCWVLLPPPCTPITRRPTAQRTTSACL